MIGPVITVFVDSRDPNDLGVNRRNQQFSCNADYFRFYTDELIPTIEQAYPVHQGREARTILGVSFGGLNAACFGLLGYVQTQKGHNWDNWRPLIDDVLLYFYGKSNGK